MLDTPKLIDYNKHLKLYKKEILENIKIKNLYDLEKDYASKVYDSHDFLINVLYYITNIEIFENILPLNINCIFSLDILIKSLGYNNEINDEDKFIFLKQFVSYDNIFVIDNLVTALNELNQLKNKTRLIQILTKFSNNDNEYVREGAIEALKNLC